MALTFPLCGILIDAFGWEMAFHTPALICLLWCVWWWYCAFDSPAQHPRISKEELEYLNKNVIISKKKVGSNKILFLTKTIKQTADAASYLGYFEICSILGTHGGQLWLHVGLHDGDNLRTNVSQNDLRHQRQKGATCQLM